MRNERPLRAELDEVKAKHAFGGAVELDPLTTTRVAAIDQAPRDLVAVTLRHGDPGADDFGARPERKMICGNPLAAPTSAGTWKPSCGSQRWFTREDSLTNRVGVGVAFWVYE